MRRIYRAALVSLATVTLGVAGCGSPVERREDQTSDWSMKRSGQELDLARANASQATAANQVAFQNAKLAYDTNVQNAQMSYESASKEAKLKMPEYEKVPGGFAIKKMEPDGSYSVKTVQTAPMMQNFEHIDKLAKALGEGNVASDSLKVQLMSDQVSKGTMDPMTATMGLKEAVVTNLVSRNQAGAVFGKEFVKAVKAAEDGVPATLKTLQATKPEAYMEYLNRATAAILMQRILQSGNNDWLVAARNAGDPIAGILVSGSQPPSAGAKK